MEGVHTLVRIGLSNSQLDKILTYDNKHRVTLLWICLLAVATQNATTLFIFGVGLRLLVHQEKVIARPEKT